MGIGQVLIDTCVVIDYSRGRAAARDFLTHLPGDPLLSVMTVAELFGGVREGTERAWLETWIGDVAVLPVTLEIARLGGVYWREHRSRHGTSVIDALIAATARIHGARLATRNVRHFPMLDDLLVPYK
jgi:predicted nucleic acid-binding protein